MLETANQMHRRLLGVIAKSRFEALARPYAWQPMPDSRGVPTGALAAVNDGGVWYALAPVMEGANDSYRIFAFHFAEGTNASGFVAWLADLRRKPGRWSCAALTPAIRRRCGRLPSGCLTIGDVLGPRATT